MANIIRFGGGSGMTKKLLYSNPTGVAIPNTISLGDEIYESYLIDYAVVPNSPNALYATRLNLMVANNSKFYMSCLNANGYTIERIAEIGNKQFKLITVGNVNSGIPFAIYGLSGKFAGGGTN